MARSRRLDRNAEPDTVQGFGFVCYDDVVGQVWIECTGWVIYWDQGYGPVFVRFSQTGEIRDPEAVAYMAFTDSDHNFAFPSSLLQALRKGLSHCLLPGKLRFEKGFEIFDPGLFMYRVLLVDTVPVSGVVEMKFAGNLGALVGCERTKAVMTYLSNHLIWGVKANNGHVVLFLPLDKVPVERIGKSPDLLPSDIFKK